MSRRSTEEIAVLVEAAAAEGLPVYQIRKKLGLSLPTIMRLIESGRIDRASIIGGSRGPLPKGVEKRRHVARTQIKDIGHRRFIPLWVHAAGLVDDFRDVFRETGSEEEAASFCRALKQEAMRQCA